MLSNILNFAYSMSMTSIEVYEWTEADVRKKRLSNSPSISKLTKQLPSLALNGWKLAHAVVKADFLDRRNLTMPGLGFLLQAHDIINFGSPSLELKPGASSALNDFTLTSLSGRVGQGLAILYGHSLGMKFVAHLSSHVKSLPAGSVGAVPKSAAMADFLFARGQQTILIESKGSFTQRLNDPSDIKSVLKTALVKQVDPWLGYLQPTPTNGYVVYSCLRESSWAPSSLHVVDPEGDGGEGVRVPMSADQVVRENYGAWLSAMGLTDAAKRLMQRSTDVGQPVAQKFHIAELNGRSFAFLANRNTPVWRSRLLGWFSPIIGIDLVVLRAISLAIQTRDTDLQALLTNLPEYDALGDEFASIFPDGSILGQIDMRKPIHIESIDL